MDIILSNGISLYIKANEKILLNRLENAKSQRPLFWGLTKQEIEQKLIQLIEIRSPFYKRATLEINGANADEKEIAKIIREHQSL
jgi:shikimate kinase